MATYVPRVLLCGDVAEFKKIIGDKPAEIVGQVNFDNAKLFLDGKSLRGEDVRQLLDGFAEYLIFTDDMQFHDYLDAFPMNTQVFSAKSFAKKIRGCFFSNKNLALLQHVLNRQKFQGRVLDFDSYIAESDFKTRNGWNVEIDGLGKFFPIMENLYAKIYKTFDECRYHVFDAIILAKERSPQEFIDALIQTENLSDRILAFIRKNSPLKSWIKANQNIFAQIETFPIENGAWCLIKKIVPPAEVGVYVVTHKDVNLSALPDGYKIIHAGHARADKDLGYIGDDTGDNISRLNPFLDEITALYWIWKNTNHTHTGIVHYRRFFSAQSLKFKVENILSAAEILKILSEYDIILTSEYMGDRNQRELMIYSTKIPPLVALSEKIVRKHLAKNQPDYLDAYDEVINGFVFFLCGIHITRRNIFDAYCEWLFSFMLDATEELARKVTFGDKKLADAPHNLSRMMSFFSERMLTVWLMKNNLRIKSLPMMFRE